MSDTDLGRLPPNEVGKAQTLDNPSTAYAALLSKVDELITFNKALTAKLDADGGVTDSNYAATLTDDQDKLAFRL